MQNMKYIVQNVITMSGEKIYKKIPAKIAGIFIFYIIQ